MKRTKAEDIIIHALCPGPGPSTRVVAGPLVPRVRLFRYASRSATRCSSDGVCLSTIAPLALAPAFVASGSGFDSPARRGLGESTHAVMIRTMREGRNECGQVELMRWDPPQTIQAERHRAAV